MCGFCARIVICEIFHVLFTLVVEVTLCVERELVHLHTATVEYLNLEVLVRLCATDREVDVAFEQACGPEDVSTYVLLLIDENPTFSILSCCFVTCEVSAPNLPVLPVTVGVNTSVTTCYEAVVRRLDGLILLCFRIDALEDNEAVTTCTSTPLCAIAVTVNQGSRTFCSIPVIRGTGDEPILHRSSNRIGRCVSVGKEICYKADSFSSCFCASKLTVGLDVSKVTTWIIVIWLNPSVNMCQSFVCHIVVSNLDESLVACSYKLGITVLGFVNLLNEFID